MDQTRKYQLDITNLRPSGATARSRSAALGPAEYAHSGFEQHGSHLDDNPSALVEDSGEGRPGRSTYADPTRNVPRSVISRRLFARFASRKRNKFFSPKVLAALLTSSAARGRARRNRPKRARPPRCMP